MRGHARRRLKCRIRDRGRLTFQWRVPGLVRVRVRSQEVPGAEHIAGQWSPRRAEMRAQGTVPVTIPLWLPRPHMLILPWWRRPPESFRAAEAGPGKPHGELPVSMPSQPEPLRVPGTWCCQTLEIGPDGEKPQLGLGFCPGTSRGPGDSRLVISLQASSEGPCQSRLNCRVRDRGRLRFRWRVRVRGRVRVRVNPRSSGRRTHSRVVVSVKG